ncbi:hypothetical protein L1987_58908 [Smallanthus sonchifolius]|uniref:Uncharacterized protein n=1 Tax=Smallanthus sonchifolius TaxID=185202 RepID=A0ACB9D4M6_9ASTR|nr:hypothetical protein L1987_58908 [Smallanthus sonchifolius]
MNASKVEEDLFHHHHLDPIDDPQPLILDHHDHQEEQPSPPEFCLPPMPEFDFFRDEDEDDSMSHTSSDADGAISSDQTNPRFPSINPEPHISSQFYTFNIESHSLMIRCILEGRLATPDEIKDATPLAVLNSWRSVWKDRNEDTAQKYIRYKPFMAEVKDYACHRAGEPASSSKKSRNLKREPYASKRCGCRFRIRAIVPILNYNEKDKTFVYQEEGTAVFKLYAVHLGHEPGPLDGNARIMHRVLGHKGWPLMEQDMIFGMSDEAENECFAFVGEDNGDMQCSGHTSQIQQGCFLRKLQPDDVLVGDNDLADWSHHQKIYGDDKDTDLIEDDDDSFGQTIGDVASWDQIRADCRTEKDLLGEACKPENWLKCGGFDEKVILNNDESKLIKPVWHDETMETDSLVSLQVDSFYPENHKWYESPCGLGPEPGCCDDGFRHGDIV